MFRLIVVVGLIIFVGHTISNRLEAQKAEEFSKPWWTGSTMVLACKLPYYASERCYTLDAISNGETITRLNFNNGGYFTINNAHCVQAASTYNFDRICTFTDDDGNEWDILPLWASI